MAARPSPPAECAQCGAAIPPTARACPECGADERTGWRESSIYDGVDFPEEVNDTAGTSPTRRVNGLAWYWWCIGVAILLLVGLSFLGLR